MIEEVFGQVHMLSHLVGSANRVDIARLTKLERELSRQAERAKRQEERLKAAAGDRSVLQCRIQALEAECLQKRVCGDAKVKAADPAEVAGLMQRLEAEKAHAAALAERLRKAEEQLCAAARRVTGLEAQVEDLQIEIHALEAALSPDEADQAVDDQRDLFGVTLLYVGGRPKLVEHLKATVARRGGALLAHDGGIEDNATLLPGLISQADHAFFPVDCISHGAATKVKKLCREAGKPFVPLRSASLAGFLAAVGALQSPQRDTNPN